MPLGHRLDHVLEEAVTIRGHQAIVEIPVHLELSVGVLVIVLIRTPAELDHAIADLTDHVVAAHQRGLVVAGLLLDVARIRNAGAGLVDEEILALDAGLHPLALRGRARDLTLEHDAGRGLDLLTVHP